MDTFKMGAGDREFPVTDWGRLLRIQDPANPDFSRTFNNLAEQYWTPVFHYIRVLRRASVEDAKDLTQQFFTLLLSRGDFSRLEPGRGSFRGFLKTSIRNFLTSDTRARTARNPRDGAQLYSIHTSTENEDWDAEPEEGLSPEEAFDREWARIVLCEAVETLEFMLTAEGKRVHFDVFREYCVEPTNLTSLRRGEGSVAEPPPVPTYADLASRYRIKESDVGNYLRHCKKRMQEILKSRIRTYLDEGLDVEEELAFLLSS